MEWIIGAAVLALIVWAITGGTRPEHVNLVTNETYPMDNETMAKIIMAVKADAWDEGYSAGRDTLFEDRRHPVLNPFRSHRG